MGDVEKGVAGTERRIAMVSGASRGIGKGVAVALGRAGYRVHLVGRSESIRSNEAMLPGTLEETAALVNQSGGEALIEHCDMGLDEDVRTLFTRVRATSGGLDLLVNNAAFLHNDMNLATPFWEKSEGIADIIQIGLRCHYLALRYAVPMMIGRSNPLVVNVSFFGHAGMHDPAYCAAKAGLDAMAASAAKDLQSVGIACVSLWPGIVATERLVALMEDAPALRQQLPPLESPNLVGRTIASLASDSRLPGLNGKTLIVAELAGCYGLMLDDGSPPISLRPMFGAPHPRNDVSDWSSFAKLARAMDGS